MITGKYFSTKDGGIEWFVSPPWVEYGGVDQQVIDMAGRGEWYELTVADPPTYRVWQESGGELLGHDPAIIATNPEATDNIDVAAKYIKGSEQELYDETRRRLSAQIDGQIPVVTVTHEVADPTARAKVEQAAGRADAAHLSLAATDDADLDTFDADLATHPMQEPDYARVIASQEVRNLDVHNSLVAAGNGGIYSATEITGMQDRITWNAKVTRGEESATQTPAVGAPRGDVALDGETVRKAVFSETTFNWSAQDYFIPLFVLDDIPEGIVTGQVFAMVYDSANTYLGWMPFTEQVDGTWSTPSDVSYIGLAKTVSSVWRCAVAYQGTQPEYEITRRVYLVPPNSATSPVRWGGRT